MNKPTWRILARHKWVAGAVISESVNSASTRKRFTATIRGFRGWKLWEGGYGEAQGVAEKVADKVRALVERVDVNDESVFTEQVRIGWSHGRCDNPKITECNECPKGKCSDCPRQWSQL